MWDLETIKMLNNRHHRRWQEKERQRMKLKNTLKNLDPEMHAKLENLKGVFSK